MDEQIGVIGSGASWSGRNAHIHIAVVFCILMLAVMLKHDSVFAMTEAKLVRTTELRASLLCPGEVSSAALSPNGKILACSFYDWEHIGKQAEPLGRLLLFDVERNRTLHCLRMQGEVYKLSFSPDGATLAGMVDSHLTQTTPKMFIRVWDIDSGKTRTTLPHSDVDRQRGITFSPDGKLLAVADFADDRQVVILYKVPTWKVFRRLQGFNWGYLVDVAFSDSGKLVASVSREKEMGSHGIAVWNIQSEKPLYQYGEDIAMGRPSVSFGSHVVILPGDKRVLSGNASIDLRYPKSKPGALWDWKQAGTDVLAEYAPGDSYVLAYSDTVSVIELRSGRNGLLEKRWKNLKGSILGYNSELRRIVTYDTERVLRIYSLR